ncbi:MAG TPA: VCBS repeat-containing protein, partial [Minicystis sp.]|nr:VCBS repeat-containing protein [Minicystis sp.]
MQLACADLPPLGECGNGVLDEHEDCDGAPGQGPNGEAVPCGKPSDARACRYTCDGNDQAPGACPSGYVCGGFDHVCRKPAGAFSDRPIATLPVGPDALAAADFDGDGYADVYVRHGASNPASASVVFFEQGGARSSTVPVPGFQFGAAGPLTSTAADLIEVTSLSYASSYSAGMLVLRGGKERSFLPASFSSLPVPKKPTTFLPLRAGDARIAVQGDRLVEFYSYFSIDAAETVVGLGEAPAAAPEVALLGDPASHAAERIAVPFADHVAVYDGMTNASKFAVSVPMTPITGVWLSRYDADARTDMVIEVTPPADVPHYFHALGASDPDHMISPGDMMPSTTVTAAPADDRIAAHGRIVAVANLTGRELPEVLTEKGLFGFGYDGQYEKRVEADWPAQENPPGKPNDLVAAIGDFNHDGLPDVLVGSRSAPDLHYIVNAGHGQYDTGKIGTAGSTTALVCADVDGDVHDDAVFVQHGSDVDEIGVIFGSEGALPGAPKLVGPFETISQLVVAPNLLSDDLGTTRADIVAVTGSDPGHLALMPGKATRELAAPFYFVPDQAKSPDTPGGFALGEFVAGGGPSVASFTSSVTFGNMEGGLSAQNSLWLLGTAHGALGALGGTPVDSCGFDATMVIPLPRGDHDDVGLLSDCGSFITYSAQGGSFVQTQALPFDDALVGTGTSMRKPVGDLPLEAGAKPPYPVCAGDLDG